MAMVPQPVAEYIQNLAKADKMYNLYLTQHSGLKGEYSGKRLKEEQFLLLRDLHSIIKQAGFKDIDDYHVSRSKYLKDVLKKDEYSKGEKITATGITAIARPDPKSLPETI